MAKGKYDYFENLEALGRRSVTAAYQLKELLEDYTDIQTKADNLHATEHQADEEIHNFMYELNRAFVTPIDREDIVALANHLDNIIDFIEDVAQRLYMFNITYIPRAAVEMAVLIEKSAEALHVAFKDFRNFKKSKSFHQLLVNVNDYEEEADKVYLAAIRDLYINHTDDPIYVLAWNNIFNRMETCTDYCENTATAMGTIVLKNS